MATREIIIRGGKGKLDLPYLEAVADQIDRARRKQARIEISIGLFRRVLRDLIRFRRQELADSKEIEEIVSAMGSEFALPISASRQGPDTIDISDLEITDLERLGGGASYELLEEPKQADQEPEEEEEEEEEDVVIAPVKRTTLLDKRREYWLPALNPYRVLFISLMGLFVLLAFVLLGG